MDVSRKGDGTSNVPHMHLFMSLKKKFPSLKDSHITDSIQRFGLDKGRCEEELNRRSNDQHRGYNSPWNRSRASSRSSTGSRNSPLSPSDCSSHISSPLQNGSASSTPISGEPLSPLNPCIEVEKERIEHPSEISLLETSSGFHTSTTAVYSSASNSQVLTSPAYNDSRRTPRQPLKNGPRTTNGFVDPKRPPNSAPVIPNSVDAFEIPPVWRRSSAETVTKNREMLPLDPNLLQQVPLPDVSSGGVMDPKCIPSPSHSPSLIPSTPTNTTTTMSSTSTAPLPVTTCTVFSSYPAALKEQISRRDRLKEVLARRIEEKVALYGEVRNLSKELEEKQKMQRLEVIKNKKEIQQIQEENSRYQCACDEMEREILGSGESPKTDQERQAAQRDPPPTPHRPAPLPPAASANSFSSACSGVSGPPSNVLYPTRRAPSPPANSVNPNYAACRHDQTSQRPGVVVINDDIADKEWSCSKCTLINSSYLNECELCGFPHFGIGTPPITPHLPHQNHISSTPNPGGPCYCHHRHYNMNHEHRSAVRDI